MPIVVAGDTCKFITGYTTAGNAQADYGKNVWLAQSFPISATSRLLRCPFLLWDSACGNIKYFALRHALADGTPTGANIAETHISPQTQNTYPPGKWLLIDFMSFPNLTAGQYALLAYVPDAHFTTDQHIAAQATPRLYTGGKAFRSTDSGATWSEIPNTNLLFQIWGWEEPPPPPPQDAIGNWYQDVPAYPTPAPDFTITTVTNIKVHQFLRWTLVPPQKHIVPLIVRGATAGTYIDQCFVSYHDVEQNELGDTLTHTFTFTDWPVCQTRYYYLWATKLAQLMPSASPIYTKHRLTPPPPTIVKIYSDPGHLLTTVDGAVYRNGTNLTWPDLHDGVGTVREYIQLRYYVWLSGASAGNRWTMLQRHKATFNLACIPLGSTIEAVSYYFWPSVKACSFSVKPTFALYIPPAPPWNDVVTSDYQGMLSTAISTLLTYDEILTSAFNHHDILPAYLSLFQPGQLARIAQRIANWDAGNSPPPWWGAKNAYICCRTVDYTDPTQRPYLQISYYPP
jgi:hypothetical protein